ncbi:erythromycin esterase family protein [Kitasatospora sp. NBC_01287]|uniref:erythromycin esterase family protein n=1 Tax=Kitasatospora sp. NBC_01287 TaxID=2903573 RepID=UPI0022591012|nr:erythromycin esterase family protein [Kitasatospora sp. NBC_01287]MCX4751319.1 erythromycin esterase family protein [Kitasatospora sp. NBC_01287]
MTEKTTTMGRRPLLVAAAATVGALLAPTSAYADQEVPARPDGQDPVRALALAAHPLRSTEPGPDTADLRPLGAMIGDAAVVGLGEATHGSHEFFALKERVFRYLVEEKGFTTFALEIGWPSGLLIDEYLQSGRGDARQVVQEALGGSPFGRQEFLHLIEWMRDHNRRAPGRRVHFMGDDVGAPRVGDDFFERVTGYVGRHQPRLGPRFTELYAGLRPLDDAIAYTRGPLAERQRLAANAQQALELLEGSGAGGEEYEWTVQHARSIAQTAAFLACDFGDAEALSAAELQRDRLMAENIAWWQRHTGHRMLLSAHDQHVAYVTADPVNYPKLQGAFLRETLGGAYLAIGTTFDQGSFLSQDTSLEGPWKKFTVDAAAPGSNEYTLARVRSRDYFLDTRSAPAVARAWLDTARPTRQIGTQYPCPPEDVAIGPSYDVLVHLQRVREADLPR